VTAVPSVRLERRAVVAPLAVSDAWRLVRHPLVLAGVALGLVMLWGTGGRINGAFELLMGYGLMPLAIGTCLAGHLMASRDHRNGTTELAGTLPTRASTRVLASFAALTGPLAVAVAYLCVALAVVSAWDGVPVALEEGIVMLQPAAVELLQGLVSVVFFGVLGVTLGAWIPSRALPPVLLAALLFLFTVLGWNADGWLRWALPLTHHEQRVLEWVQVTPSWGYSVTDGYDRVAMAWHVGYLTALSGLVAAVGVLRHDRSRRLGAGAVVLAALAAALSVVQVP
jgi:hypothetical protein